MPSRSRRSIRRVMPERLSSTCSASSAIRSRPPGARSASAAPRRRTAAGRGGRRARRRAPARARRGRGPGRATPRARLRRALPAVRLARVTFTAEQSLSLTARCDDNRLRRTSRQSSISPSRIPNGAPCGSCDQREAAAVGTSIGPRNGVPPVAWAVCADASTSFDHEVREPVRGHAGRRHRHPALGALAVEDHPVRRLLAHRLEAPAQQRPSRTPARPARRSWRGRPTLIAPGSLTTSAPMFVPGCQRQRTPPLGSAMTAMRPASKTSNGSASTWPPALGDLAGGRVDVLDRDVDVPVRRDPLRSARRPAARTSRRRCGRGAWPSSRSRPRPPACPRTPSRRGRRRRPWRPPGRWSRGRSTRSSRAGGSCALACLLLSVGGQQ